MLVKNNKWYRNVAQAQLIVFALMHLILGMYFAFVSSVYANHPGFTATIKEHRYLDQIFAIVCFVLFVMGLRLILGLRKNKKISFTYYIYMVLSAVLPLVYLTMSDAYLVGAMKEILETGYPEYIIEGKGEADWIAYWTGVEFGAWAHGLDITNESEVVLNYLSAIGAKAGEQVELANFDLSGLLGQLRNDMYSWGKFELYSVINVAVTAVFAVLGVIFLPIKKKASKK